MVNIVKLFITIVLCFTETYSFADVQSTREVLSYFSTDNFKVLKSYDDLTKSLTEHQALHPKFDLEKLLIAIEFAAEKHARQLNNDLETPSILLPLRISELLWNVGSIRNVNVLVSAFLQYTLAFPYTTEEEIATLFGPRILYIVKEVTDDSTVTQEENKFSKVLEMSLEGQIIKLAEALHNMKNLYPLPIGWTKEKIEKSTVWGEKLLSELNGITNSGLEYALQIQIEDYRNEINGKHIITHRNDTYYTTSYFIGDDFGPLYKDIHTHTVPVLDNGTSWQIEDELYMSKGLHLDADVEVEIKQVEENRYFPIGYNHRYLMIIYENGIPSKSILFIRTSSTTFQATTSNNTINIMGLHAITNVHQDEGAVYFSLMDDSRVWKVHMDVYNEKKISIENGDEVEVSEMECSEMERIWFEPTKYLMNFPEKSKSFIFRKPQSGYYYTYEGRIEENREYFGVQKISNVVTLFKNALLYEITFNLAGRAWHLWSNYFYYAISIEDNDEAQARPDPRVADGYIVTFPGKNAIFRGKLGEVIE